MKRYDEYKETNQVWLPFIPKHWDTIKIKYQFDEISDKNHADEIPLVASQHMGVVPKSIYGLRTVEATKGLDLFKRVMVGDFVISLRSFQGGLEFAYYQGIISPAYTILRCKNNEFNQYYRYLFKSAVFIKLLTLCVTGIREGQNIDYATLKQFSIPVPPSSEQDQIVRYLDWQTSRINKLIKGYKRQIELLEERKKAVVSNAIIHGLKKDIPLKDSGVYWIGDIPKHWSTIKLRRILSPVSIKNCPDMQLLSVVREQGVIIRDTENKESNHNYIPDDLSNYKVVRKNQFVINKMKAWQGSYGVSGYDGLVSPAYFVFNVNFNNLEYFHYAIRSKVYVNFFAQASDGIRVGQWDLDMQKMKEIPFIVPSEEEQVEIVRYIKKEHKKLDVSIEKWKSKIELLKEYRTRLISDVVTGQVDVRDIQIPEYIPEEETEMTDMEVEKDAD